MIEIKRLFIFAYVLLSALFLLAGCGFLNKAEASLLLYLKLDEGQGNTVCDAAGNLAPATVQYVFTTPEFQETAKDPEWRENGVKGGALLFDGYSNYIRYGEDEIKVRGNALTVSAFVAPRCFEWDNPAAVASGEEKLTALVSQFNKSTNQGFVLGYHRHGHFSFQVGLGDRWISVWDEDRPLKKYEWNHVAGVFDGDSGRIALYLNGELVGEKLIFEGAKIAGCDDYLYVGKNSEPGSNATASLNMVSGLMDEIKIYKTALKEKEIRKNYEKYGKIPIIEFEDIWLQNILVDDIYKTQYHGGPYQHWMNEPHAPCYYNGVYHLFFQFNMFGPYFRNICWGHLVSTDMVNWRPLKEVITPTEGSVCPDGVWSGGVAYDNDGVPVLLFTAGNDSYRKSGLISNQNIGIARPLDASDPYLTEWIIDDELAIRQVSGQGRTGEFRDAHVYKEGDAWYLLVGSGSTVYNTGGTALLYETRDDSFKNWTYRGQIYEIENQRSDLGQVWELPVLLPVSNRNKTITKYVFIISPAPADRADNDIYYFLGDFDKKKGRFIPDDAFAGSPRLLDYGNNVFTGPSGFVDPVSEKTYLFSIMQDQRKPGDVAKAGWANCVGLARELYLSDDGSDVHIKAIDALSGYEKEVLIDIADKSLDEINQMISGVEGDMLHIKVTFGDIGAGAKQFGIKARKNKDLMEETVIYYDAETKQAGIKTGLSGSLHNYQNIKGNFFGPLELNDNELTIDIYLDRSLVETFFNNQKAVSARIYPDAASRGVQLFAAGGEVTIKSLRIAVMRSIYAEDG